MSNTISGGISFGGIGSGMDMNAIVGQLKKVQEIPVNRLNLTKAENEYRIKALEAVMQQMRDSNSILKKFNMPSKLLNLNIESSNSGVASATVLGNADLTEGSYTIDVKQIAKASIYTSNKTFEKKESVINDTGTAKKFGYTYKGVTRELEVPKGTTLEQFVKRINNDAKNPGVKASLVKSGSGYLLQIQGKDTGKDAELIISSDLDSFKSSEKLFTGSDIVINNSGAESTMKYFYKNKEHTFKIKDKMTAKEFVDEFNKDDTQAVKAKLTRVGSDYKIEFTEKSNNTPAKIKIESDIPVLGDKKQVISGKDTLVNNSGKQEKFTAEFDGAKKVEFDVPQGTTLEKFVELFNQNTNNTGIEAKLVESASGYKVEYIDKNNKDTVISPTKVTQNNMPGLDTASNGNWHVQHAQDAIFTINGSDKVMTSDTNKLTEVIEGMEITLKSEGETVLTVASDTSKLKENIREVVDAINLVKKTILELSKVDEEKETTNPEDNKMSSQLTWQKGSALTGNYGVQLFLTEFNTINTSMGGGFRKKDAVDDIFGDVFTVLSEIGIKTNANAGDPNFGLLEIDEEKLDKALKEDMDAVVELFSAPLGGTTPSSEFIVASAGMHARPGNYGVKYDVNANGEAVNVYINGVKAHNDPEFPGRWTVAESKNDAAGVAIQFPNGGMATGTGFTSEVRIRQGKINELSSFLDRELVQTTVTGVEQGKIPTIIAGLRKNIENIETKVAQETDRIALWEQRERLKFSRLEEVLTKYNSQMNSIASMASGMMPR